MSSEGIARGKLLTAVDTGNADVCYVMPLYMARNIGPPVGLVFTVSAPESHFIQLDNFPKDHFSHLIETGACKTFIKDIHWILDNNKHNKQTKLQLKFILCTYVPYCYACARLPWWDKLCGRDCIVRHRSKHGVIQCGFSCFCYSGSYNYTRYT